MTDRWDADDLPLPDDLAGFRAVREIGRGGTGVVYLVESSAGWMAIKRLSHPLGPAAVDPAALSGRARALAGIVHPHIVHVDDLRVAHGHLCIVMEYVNGPDLRQLLTYRRPRPEQALGWLEQVAAALDYLHGLGLLHRDVKPSNVLVTADDEAKLGDLWLPPGPDLGLPPPLGTTAYLAPELARGNWSAGAGADIYSLAVMAYQVLVGTLPFPVDPSNPDATLRAHLYQPPPDPGTIVPDFPPAVSRALLWGLSKAPESRPRSAGVLVAAVAGAWRDASPSALPPEIATERRDEADVNRTRSAPLVVRSVPATPPAPPGAVAVPPGGRSPALVAILVGIAAVSLIVGGLAVAYAITNHLIPL